jgi:prophage antirepressor-like protein
MLFLNSRLSNDKIYTYIKTMLSECMHTFEQHDVAVVVCNGEPWFRASDVTSALNYKQSAAAVRQHVNQKYVRTLTDLRGDAGSLSNLLMHDGDEPSTRVAGKPPLYIAFQGVMDLLDGSRSVTAERFKQWLLMKTLPDMLGTSALCMNARIASEHYRAQLATQLDQLAYDDASNMDDSVEGDSLYIMRNTLIPHMIKLGRSINPTNRARDLSKSQPFHIVVCNQYDGYGFLEKRLHNKLAIKCAVGGRGREWFTIEPCQADLLIRAAILEHTLLG